MLSQVRFAMNWGGYLIDGANGGHGETGPIARPADQRELLEGLLPV